MARSAARYNRDLGRGVGAVDDFIGDIALERRVRVRQGEQRAVYKIRRVIYEVFGCIVASVHVPEATRIHTYPTS